MSRTTVRKARKWHRCGSYLCAIMIEPGDLYLEHVLPPNSDILDNEHWMRSKECRPCAEQCRRGAWFLGHEARRAGLVVTPGMLLTGLNVARYREITGAYVGPGVGYGFGKYDAGLQIEVRGRMETHYVDSRTLYPVKAES